METPTLPPLSGVGSLHTISWKHGPEVPEGTRQGLAFRRQFFLLDFI